MRTRARVGAALAVLLAASPCLAGAGGGDPFQFLLLDADARAVALGGAYTALAGDANALLYNPAGLGRVRRSQASFMHNQYFEGVNQEYLGVADARGWGVQLNELSFGDSPRTTVSNPDGTGLGSAGLMDLSFGAGYGRAATESLSLGVGAKAIRESIDGVSALGFGLDLGGLYSVPTIEGLSLGAAVQNIGPSVRFQGARESLPLNGRAGAAFVHEVFGRACSASLDLVKPRTAALGVETGVETVFGGALPVRIGFDSRNDAGPGITAGVGWRGRSFAFDYAFVPYGDLGITNRVSVTLFWGDEAAAPDSPSFSSVFFK
jgi:hypothetical protein